MQVEQNWSALCQRCQVAASLTSAPSVAQQVIWGPPAVTAMGCGTFIHSFGVLLQEHTSRSHLAGVGRDWKRPGGCSREECASEVRSPC